MSVKCSKCGKEFEEGSKFCNNCGNNLMLMQEKQNDVIPQSFNRFISKLKNCKNIKIIIPTAVAITVILIAAIIYFNNPIVQYEHDINNNKLMEALAIYNSKIANNAGYKQKVLNFLNTKVDSIKQDFINKKVSFDTANKELAAISQTGLMENVSQASDYISKLNDSRAAFDKGEEYAKNNDLGNAIKSYKEVIKEDSNYSQANTKIIDLSSKYKTQVLKNAEVSANSKDYQKAIDILTTASQIIDKDNDIEAKKAVYTTQLVSELQAEQQVVVLSSKVVSQSDQWKALYPDMLQAILKNNSSKTIKDMEVGWLGYDSNNYPMKIKTEFGSFDADYEFVGNAQDINVIANGTFGDKNGWDLDETHGLSKVIACVKSVTYYDGTTWDNPYYQYWLNQYKEKPFK